MKEQRSKGSSSFNPFSGSNGSSSKYFVSKKTNTPKQPTKDVIDELLPLEETADEVQDVLQIQKKTLIAKERKPKKLKKKIDYLATIKRLQRVISRQLAQGRIWITKKISQKNFSKLKSILIARKKLSYALGALLISLLVATLIIGQKDETVTKVLDQNTDQTAQTDEQPITEAPNLVDFKLVTPGGKGLEDVQGVVRTNPNKEKIVTYKDSIASIEIEVTQQKMPEAFKEDIFTKVENLAISFNASESVAEGDVTIYIGTSEEGPQTVITNTTETLIFITSSQKIDPQSWLTYVKDLK